MHVERITEPVDAVKLWPFFAEGFETVAAKTSEPVDEDACCKLLVTLVGSGERAWVGIVYDNDAQPIGFGIAQDATPLFSRRRSFLVVAFYHKPGLHDATQLLQTAFETWARKSGVGQYVVTTRRDSGAAIRCFSSGRYGFKKAYIAFEKVLHG